MTNAAQQPLFKRPVTTGKASKRAKNNSRAAEYSERLTAEKEKPEEAQVAVESPPPMEEEPPLPAFVFAWTNGTPVSDETLQQQQEMAKIISRVVCRTVSARRREEFLIHFDGPADTALVNDDDFKKALGTKDTILCIWSLFGLGADPAVVRRFSEVIKPYCDELRILLWSYDHQPYLESDALQLTRRFVALPPGDVGYGLGLLDEPNMTITSEHARELARRSVL